MKNRVVWQLVVGLFVLINKPVLAVETNELTIKIIKNYFLIEEKWQNENIQTNPKENGKELLSNNKKIKIVSVASKSKLIIPYRINKNKILIGDLNKKTDINEIYYLKYFLKKDGEENIIYFSVSNNNKKILLVANDNLREVWCDDKTKKIDIEGKKEILLDCKTSVYVKTEKNKFAFREWLSKLFSTTI